MAESLSGYRIFYEVANCKNISRAASQLYISQPAISKSIQKLEEQLGAKLFIRSSKGVLLTPEGQMLYETVQEAFSCHLYHSLFQWHKFPLCIKLTSQQPFLLYHTLPHCQ